MGPRKPPVAFVGRRKLLLEQCSLPGFSCLLGPLKRVWLTARTRFWQLRRMELVSRELLSTSPKQQYDPRFLGETSRYTRCALTSEKFIEYHHICGRFTYEVCPRVSLWDVLNDSPVGNLECHMMEPSPNAVPCAPSGWQFLD